MNTEPILSPEQVATTMSNPKLTTGYVGNAEPVETDEETQAHYAEVSKVMTAKFEALIAPARANKRLSIADNFHFKAIAKFCLITGVNIRLPKSSCKHCNGRGYTSFDTKSNSPIPCNCIYVDGMGDPEQFRKYNRNDRRVVAQKSKSSVMGQQRFQQVMSEINKPEGADGL